MELKQYEYIPNDWVIGRIQNLHESIFGQLFSIKRLQGKENILILTVWKDDHVIGYKIGYEKNEKYFYSWIGGVHAKFRNQGIASKLMQLQHNWCIDKGFQYIQTKTKNKWRNMLILNLKHDFDIIGTYTDEKGEPKIILQKQLISSF